MDNIDLDAVLALLASGDPLTIGIGLGLLVLAVVLVLVGAKAPLAGKVGAALLRVLRASKASAQPQPPPEEKPAAGVADIVPIRKGPEE